MTNFVKKYWALIALIAGFIYNESTDIIAHIVPDTFYQKLIYGIVVLVYGYFFTSAYNKRKVLEDYSKR